VVKITREEVLKLAEISKIYLHESEIDLVVEQLKSVLGYAAMVSEIVVSDQIPATKNVNVFREDLPVQTNPAAILAQAPEHEDNYFVVLPILEK
jgi:aspartyl-tRNA(Asn)/glutamyl-tRNA(Gln) amidotransferase subunit C